MRWRTSSAGGPDADLAGILAGLDAMIWHADAEGGA